MRLPFAFIIWLCAASGIVGDDAKPNPKATQGDPRLNRDTAEGTLRVFTIGVMMGNEQLIKQTALPLSDEEMKLLTTNEGAPLLSVKEIKELCVKMEVKALKAGDKVKLPGGKEAVVTKEEVSDDRMVFVLGDAPVPTRMYKAKGFWWVDPEPLLFARKAAAEKRKTQSGATSPTKK